MNLMIDTFWYTCKAVKQPKGAPLQYQYLSNSLHVEAFLFIFVITWRQTVKQWQVFVDTFPLPFDSQPDNPATYIHPLKQPETLMNRDFNEL